MRPSNGRRSRAAPRSAGTGPKGREASAPAVPPSLRGTGAPSPAGRGLVPVPVSRASLGCCWRGGHPPGPTWRGDPEDPGALRLSSAGRSGARSGVHRRRPWAPTVPRSLAPPLPRRLRRWSPVLLPVSAGCVARPSGRVVVVWSWSIWICANAASWRPSARRTGAGTTRGRPPARRAGEQLPFQPRGVVPGQAVPGAHRATSRVSAVAGRPSARARSRRAATCWPSPKRRMKPSASACR